MTAFRCKGSAEGLSDALTGCGVDLSTARNWMSGSVKRGENEPRAQLIELLKRDGGATLEDICKKFAWSPHTTRAMMSAGASLAKKHGITIISKKVADERHYSFKG
jgi:hypothetical protein